jgi:small subunit ribosomal protein S1
MIDFDWRHALNGNQSFLLENQSVFGLQCPLHTNPEDRAMAKKKSLDHLFEEDNQTKSENEFDSLLDSTAGVQSRGFVTGDTFKGEILAISGQEAFVSTGTPMDAIMPFAMAEGKEPPKVGDVVSVVVVRVRNGQILVRPQGAKGVRMDGDTIEDVFQMELPVEGTVLEAVKGGFRVKVQEHKAFCPISQMDFRVLAPEDYVGKKFSFLITKWERGRDLVVSRRKLLDIDRKASEKDFAKTGEVGAIFTGTVFRLEKYGAFVRLENGVEGLIPISEMSWGRINHPQDVVHMGQVIQAKLIRVAEEDGRLKVSLSLKQGGSTSDPWASIESQFPPGSQVEGVVEGKEQFGLFVNVAVGVTGLLPRSAWRDAADGAQYEGKRKGDKVKVRVEKIDLETHRLSFSLPREDEDDSWRAHSAVSKSSFGSLGDMLKDVKVKK